MATLAPTVVRGSAASPLPALMRVGSVAAAAVTAATVAWVALLLVGPTPPAGADAAQRLAFLVAHEGWHVAGFAVVAPLALLYIPVWLGLAAFLWSRRPAAGVLGMVIGFVYTPFGLWGYWTQLTVVRGLSELHGTAPADAVAAFQVLGFDGELWSIGYATAVLAYAIWGVAAGVLAAGLLRVPVALSRWTGGLFALTGLLSVAGAVGFVAQVALLELGVTASGVTSLAASVGTAVLLHRHAGRAAESRQAGGEAS